MADNDIKQKIILEGEQQYRNAIKEAQRNLKTLRSELKAETAELGKNATEQQKAETRAKSLQKQIAEQEKIVKANTEALEEVRQKYGDNADAVAKYEQKLNESRAALANMKNELESTGDGFRDMAKDADMATVAAKSVADTIGNLASVGDTIADSIEGIFTGMLDTIRAAVGEVWTMIAETAAKANSWTDLANAYGSTAEKVQRITKGLEWSGGSFEDLMTIIQKVNWSGDNKEKVLTNALGISDENYTDKLEYTLLVLQRLKELKETNGKGYDSIIEQVFGGKQGTRVSWFIDNWDTIQDKLTEYDESSYGMTQDELSTMNDAYVELQTIEGKWDTLKEKFAAGFGSVSLDIMTNVSGALDALSKYFNAETDEGREKALEELEKNIVGAFERVKKAIEEGLKRLDELADHLKKSENPAARAVGDILGGIVDVLEWFTEDNMSNVVKALEMLAAFWVGGKAIGMIGKITEFASQIAILKGAGLFGGMAGGAAGAAGALSNIGLTVGALAITAATVTLFASAFAWAADRRNNHPEEVRGTDENLQANIESEDLKDSFISYVKAEKELQDFLNSGEFNGDNGTDLFEQVNKTREKLEGMEGAAELLQAYSDWRQEHSYGNMDWILPDGFTETAAEKIADSVEEVIEDIEAEDPDNPLLAYTRQEKEDAIQDFFDAWREGADDLESATEWAQEVFGDDWDAVFDKMLEEWNKLTPYQQNSMDDIPADWWTGEADENGVTSEDIQSLNSLPQRTKEAVSELVGSINIYMDGELVADLLAPRVSEKIGSEIHE